MIDISAFHEALGILFSSISAWGWIVPGLIIGLVFAAIPGISITMAMAIVLPMSLYMDFFPAMVFLTSVYTGAGFGGSVPAILMNIPGTPSSFATTFDGYAMSQKGEHNEALGYALFASTLCGIFGYVLLLLVLEPLADIVLRIGPVEMFAVAIWGMMLLGSLGSTYISRGLLAAALGILLGTVGMNTAGFTRGTLGVPELLDGIAPIPAMIGLLAASQLLSLAGRDYIIEAEGAREVSLRRILKGCWGTLKYPGVLLRGSIIGVVIGAVPGVGSSISNLISYAETKRTAKDSATFGKGNPKGVIAAESAVASGEGGSMATMLALGIPGGGATAILIAAFMMHNVVPGPSFIDTQKPMAYAIILNNMVQAVVLLVVGIGFIYAATNVMKVRTRYVLPAILVVATLGTYAVTGEAAGPITLFVFAMLGFALNRYEYPVPAVVVGILLGRMLETEFLRSYQLSAGNPLYVLERPGAMAIFAVMFISLAMTAWGKRKQNKAEAAEAALLRLRHDADAHAHTTPSKG
ncbi:tripartite tricarboxylate transporter permease [Ancylobacter dichloromethanicus]|uniref:Membrane protein n=1 Tax=Ancylobacter dichloromethanicus TaxID=518825 RepID=A0A9W6J621_9HYPH|nr:tripartite tricarboxylate transporter permease [Ancylobacter dichloromethanicus]MBS7556235.1 tripartite tricarboxylate transporter permease [Ancylobacter dichloromethanicus]GLK69994.1 membrane protein [Ancylobacter dichloromethanicus]